MATIAKAVGLDQATGGFAIDFRAGEALPLKLTFRSAGVAVPVDVVANVADVQRSGALYESASKLRVGLLSKTLYSASVGADLKTSSMAESTTATPGSIDIVAGAATGEVLLRVGPDLVADPPPPNAVKGVPVVLVLIAVLFQSGARHLLPGQIICRYGAAA